MVNGSQWFASAFEEYYFDRPVVRVVCPINPHRQTPIERIFREVTGHKMPQSVRRILLR
jgi:hypothetical protein